MVCLMFYSTNNADSFKLNCFYLKHLLLRHNFLDNTKSEIIIMLAMNYRGPYRVRASQKPLPEIEHPNDAIVRVTRSCICGSDLHTYHGLVPDTRVGTTFGHEFIGVVEETGSSVS